MKKTSEEIFGNDCCIYNRKNFKTYARINYNDSKILLHRIFYLNYKNDIKENSKIYNSCNTFNCICLNHLIQSDLENNNEKNDSEKNDNKDDNENK